MEKGGGKFRVILRFWFDNFVSCIEVGEDGVVFVMRGKLEFYLDVFELLGRKFSGDFGDNVRVYVYYGTFITCFCFYSRFFCFYSLGGIYIVVFFFSL